MQKEMAGILLKQFEEAFGGAEGARVFFAPGRINLIGEHTDYNGGHVLPCAIEMGTYCAMRRREDGALRMCSGNFPNSGIIEWDLSDLANRAEAEWSNYPAGVVWALAESGLKPPNGFDAAFLGDIPNQSGLSSSASIEVVSGYAISELFGLNIQMVALALTGQKAETVIGGGAE